MKKYGNVKFLHFRYMEKNIEGIIASNGGITVAYYPRTDGKVVWAEARCHYRDNYCKSTGRAKSFGRLKSPSHIQEYIGTVAEFVSMVKNDIEQQDELTVLTSKNKKKLDAAA